MRFGWTTNDWIWRLIAVCFVPFYPILVLDLWCIEHGSLLVRAWEMARDIGLTLIYGNYDKARI